MNYTQLVTDATDRLRAYGHLKMAIDMAKLLDNPLFSISETGYIGDLLTLREKAFNRLCAIFLNARLELPPLEEVFWKRRLSHSNAKDEYLRARNVAQNYFDAAEQRLKDKAHIPQAKQCLALLQVLTMFPLAGFADLSAETLLAHANSILVGPFGLEPLRPDYAKIEIPEPITRSVVFANLVIVDDGRAELLKSALVASGIDGVTITFVHQTHVSHKDLEDEALQIELDRVAKLVLAESPDIVLMDQLMQGIKGSQLIPVIRKLAHDQRIMFVGNTGGDTEDLDNAGCYENFAKGAKPGSLIAALRRFAQQ